MQAVTIGHLRKITLCDFFSSRIDGNDLRERLFVVGAISILTSFCTTQFESKGTQASLEEKENSHSNFEWLTFFQAQFGTLFFVLRYWKN